MSDPPGRETRTAETGRRWSWAGHGEGNVVEKGGFGRFVDDLVYVFAEISVLSLPVLYHLLTSADVSYFGVKSAAMVAWMTMVGGGAILRGGWVTPLASDVAGWVSLTPSLVAFRFGYYNLVLLLAAYGGGAVATAGFRYGSLLVAFAVGGLAVGLFPRLAESVARAVG